MTHEATTAAILTAIGAVNDNVAATREGLHQFREEMNAHLGLIRADVRSQGEKIGVLEVAKVSERSFLKGFKYPMVAAGALMIVLADHWEHGAKLVSWIFR